MAKKQLLKPNVPDLKGWDEVNDALKRLAELTVAKRTLENKKTELLSEITSKFDADAAPILTEMELLNGSIEDYVMAHKDEFAKERTREMSHGTISLRVSSAVKIISKAVCLKALKGMNMLDFILVKEEPNKEMLKSLSDIELAKVACERKVTDNLSIVPKIEEIVAAGADL